VPRAHVSRRGGRRTRTLVLAVYGRGLQPVQCPRGIRKAARGCPGAAVSWSICKPLHSRPTLSMPGQILISGEIADGCLRPGGKVHARTHAHVFATGRFPRRGSCGGSVEHASHRSLSWSSTIITDEGFEPQRFSNPRLGSTVRRAAVLPISLRELRQYAPRIMERELLGEVTCPSGKLLVIDMGMLGRCRRLRRGVRPDDQ